MEQTAVEFLVEALVQECGLDEEGDMAKYIIEKAKEMEKKQMFEYIKKHYVIGENSLKFHQEQFEQYYNKTFKK